MCDFSEYGGVSEDFLAIQTTLPEAPDLSAVEWKRIINQQREESAKDGTKHLLSQVKTQDHQIVVRDGSTIEARSYRPASANASQERSIYIHFHGGGFLLGTLSSEDAICSRIVADIGVVVLNVNYRHTPEFIYPTAWHDAEDAFEWAYAHASEFGGRSDSIVIGGISAGGHLSAALAQTKFREQAPSFKSLKGQILMIPALVHQDCYDSFLHRMKAPSISSYVENEFAPILPLTRLNMFTKLLYPSGTPDSNDRRANPGNASQEELQGLPPTVLGIAGLDVLRDEGLLFAQSLAQAGVPTDVHVFRGVPHGFRRFGDKLKASAAWDKVMHEGIRWTLSNPPASIEVDIHVH